MKVAIYDAEHEAILEAYKECIKQEFMALDNSVLSNDASGKQNFSSAMARLRLVLHGAIGAIETFWEANDAANDKMPGNEGLPHQRYAEAD